MAALSREQVSGIKKDAQNEGPARTCCQLRAPSWTWVPIHPPVWFTLFRQDTHQLSHRCYQNLVSAPAQTTGRSVKTHWQTLVQILRPLSLSGLQSSPLLLSQPLSWRWVVALGPPI